MPAPERGPGRFWTLHWVIATIVLFAIVIVGGAYERFLSPPPDAPSGVTKTIPAGATLSSAAISFVNARMIRSEFSFKALVAVLGGPRGVKAGQYYFSGPESAVEIAWRVTHSQYGLSGVRVTIPEGLSVKDIGALLARDKGLAKFDEATFLTHAKRYEGYLFPDTYEFAQDATADDIIKAMRANFDRRIATVLSDVQAFGRPLSDVITMASILEDEARTAETRETIAGILWKRLDMGMPLQVDSSIVYATGKADGNKLSKTDFSIDSSYNTYTHVGLPPTPISNPGLASIEAAVHPTPSKYLYYLTDPEGGFHPAMTNAEQEANRAKYLGY